MWTKLHTCVKEIFDEDDGLGHYSCECGFVLYFL